MTAPQSGGTFVSIGTGTQSMARLLDRIVQLAPTLPQPLRVQFGNTPYSGAVGESFAFTSSAEFVALLESCELFITHGGAGSVFSALRLAKKPVVVARLKAFDEVVDDHQVAFARELGARGLVHPVIDIADLESAIAAARQDPALPEPFLGDPQARKQVREALDTVAPGNGKVLLVCPSGGHLTEIRALAECYSHRPHHYAMNVPIVEPDDMKGRTSIITLSQRDWKFLINLREAAQIIRRERPSVILTTGGGFSVAFTIVGKIFGIPTVYIETAAKVDIPTATGRVMYWIADIFLFQWEQVSPAFPNGKFIGIII